MGDFVPVEKYILVEKTLQPLSSSFNLSEPQ